MAVKPVLICDVDGVDGDTQVYKITFPDGEVWEVDLCGHDSERLEWFREQKIGGPAKRGRRRSFEVTSLEQIQGQAKKGRKRS